MRVLLVEDNEDDARLVTSALREHAVVTVALLGEAMALADLQQFDVALTELSLPDSCGVDAVERLREAAQNLPLVVLTHVSDDRIAQSALELGAQDFIRKEEFSKGGALAAATLERVIRYAVLRQNVGAKNQRLLQNLRDSKTLLERKNERLETLCRTAQTFVEDLSHDFRTPLTVIKEYSSLIRDGVAGPIKVEQCRLLKIVEDRADDLNTMVDDLLDASKMESGLVNMWRRRGCLASIVENVMHGLECKAEVRGVVLETAIEPGLPDIFCDEEHVARIIINLVVNAIKFCKEDDRVRVWAKRYDDRRELVVGVTDNGPGIPADKLKIILERFKQASGDVRQNRQGFGLGLSIAQELADMNLGRLDVESVVGEGSTFTFSLPYAVPQEAMARYLMRARTRRDQSPSCSVISISADPESRSRDLEDLDALVSHAVRRDDLTLRVGAGRWIMVLLVSPTEVDGFLNRIRTTTAEVSRNRPLGPLPEVDVRVEMFLELKESLDELQNQVAPLLISSLDEAACV